MNTIKGTYRNGCITPEAPSGWPDGMRVFIEPEPPGLAWERTTGKEWPEDKEPPTWDWTATMGTYQNGRVCPDERVDWPDGTQVDLEAKPEAGKKVGMSEDDWPTTPEGIAARLAEMDALEPLEMTEEETASWEAHRQAQKEFEKARFFEDAEKLRRMWE